jgi:hypothetical protein
MATETIGGLLLATPHQATVIKLGLPFTIVPTKTVGGAQIKGWGVNNTFFIMFSLILFHL